MPLMEPRAGHTDARWVVPRPRPRPGQVVLDGFGPWHDGTVLATGCESGGLVSSVPVCDILSPDLDDAPELVEIAVHRVPGGAFRLGDVRAWPFLVSVGGRAGGGPAVGGPAVGGPAVGGPAGFRCAADPVQALAEAARVTCPGGRVLAMVWGPADECDAAEYLAAVRSRLSPAAEPAGPFRWSDPAAQEDLFARAGLAVDNRWSVECSWHYADETAAVRGLLSTGPGDDAVDCSGAVGEAVRASIAPFRCPSGAYLLCNTFHAVLGYRPAGRSRRTAHETAQRRLTAQTLVSTSR